VWDNFPSIRKVELAVIDEINLSSVLPADLRYYNYIGSLTTPPCSMGLQWVILKSPLRLSQKQIQRFKDVYDHNYRPVQPLNNRLVYEKI
jgi:carbonic anhydrase